MTILGLKMLVATTNIIYQLLIYSIYSDYFTNFKGVLSHEYFGPLMISLHGLQVNAKRVALLQSEYVGGVILFCENIESEAQVKELIDSIKSIDDKMLLLLTKKEVG